MRNRRIRISHEPSGAVIAEGPVGWGITPFEGNYYIRRRYLRPGVVAATPIPGLCPYKGLYQWLVLRLPGGARVPGLAWLYWLPNPLFPFIWFRTAVSGRHPDIRVEEI
ncbi:MAG: DUF427 domain-containing protein [Gemmatimonadales bacterium]